MSYAIEINFDEDTESKFVRIFQELNSSCLLNNSVPHISLSVHEELDLNLAKKIVKTVFQKCKPFEVKFSTLAAFEGKESVIFASPANNSHLGNYHEKLHSALIEEGILSHEYYLPENWIPHLTLDFAIPANEYDQKFKTAQSLFAPITAEARKVSIVTFLPFRTLYSIKL